MEKLRRLLHAFPVSLSSNKIFYFIYINPVFCKKRSYFRISRLYKFSNEYANLLRTTYEKINDVCVVVLGYVVNLVHPSWGVAISQNQFKVCLDFPLVMIELYQ